MNARQIGKIHYAPILPPATLLPLLPVIRNAPFTTRHPRRAVLLHLHGPVGVVILDPVGEFLEAVPNRRVGLVAEELPRLRDVRVGALHVTRLHRKALNLRLDAEGLPDAVNQGLELGRLRAAEVDDLVLGRLQRVRPVQARHDAIDDVRDVGVVAARRPVAVHRNGLAGEQLARELVDSQVGPLARAVDGEKPQAVHRHVVEVVIGVGDQLARALRGSVRRNRMMHRVFFAERHLLVVTIDRRGGAEDEGLDLHLPGKLQHRLRTRDRAETTYCSESK